MLPRLWVLAAGLVAALGCALVDAAPAEAQGRIVGRYGDWQIRCQAEVGAPSEQCALVQNVQAQDRANIALSVVFIRTADQQVQILRVLAPLAILLPPGLGLSIDNVEVGAAGFVRCLASGCVAEVRLDDGLIERFEAGTTATFSIFRTPEEGIGIPISLEGFADGFAALENPPTETLADVAPPREPVATSTSSVSGIADLDTRFTPDDRTALDQLLEDDLFPYVAGAAGAVFLLIVVGGLLLVRGRSKPKPRRSRPAAKAKGGKRAAPTIVEDAEDDAEGADLEDLDDAEEDLRDEPVAPTRQQPRMLAAPRQPRAPTDPAPTPVREPRRLPGSEAGAQGQPPRRTAPPGPRPQTRPPRSS
ncbi:invasion associated locus B family protein [Acuticoccus sp. I52.16.1]|uniref:invasion associated locus B family protein n=1 Tax=Acuticoccus sp. I52.16.1 TaxID=2928472 RepID=UPI00352F2008